MDASPACWAQKLIDSYRDDGGVNTSNEPGLPSKPEIASLCLQLMQLLFPGYHDSGSIGKAELSGLTLDRVNALNDDLRRVFQCALSGQDDVAATATAAKIFNELPAIRAMLQTDVEAAYEGDPAARTRDEIILSYPCLEAIAIQRVAHFLYRHDIPLVPRMMTEWSHTRTGIDIHPCASIGSHFFIDHGTGVVIGETCRIGAHVKLYHGVTLGPAASPKTTADASGKGESAIPTWRTASPFTPTPRCLAGRQSSGATAPSGATSSSCTASRRTRSSITRKPRCAW